MGVQSKAALGDEEGPLFKHVLKIITEGNVTMETGAFTCVGITN